MRYQGKAAFLISKPLQLMISLCIVRQYIWNEKPIFIILDAFCGARSVAERLLQAFADLQQPVFFKQRKQAFKFVRQEAFDHFFIDSDVGVKNYLLFLSRKMAKPKLGIHVYEEGLGTYRDDLYQGLKKNLLSAFGGGTFFGGSVVASSIFVFDDQEYIAKFPKNKHKVVKIVEPLQSFITENRDQLKQVFDYAGMQITSADSELCVIYLSNWQLDGKFISRFVRMDGVLYVKPHPHIYTDDVFYGVQVIPAHVPAELVLMEALELYKAVSVYDHYSSVRRYLKDAEISFFSIEDGAGI